MSILEELYNGNVRPSDKYIKDGSEYQKLNKELMRHVDELLEHLDREQRILCEKIADLICDLSYISEREYYIDGFCTGAQLMREIINNKSHNFI